MTCLIIKKWLLGRFTHPSLSAPGILRMESQNLHRLTSKTAGRLLVLDHACHFSGDPRRPITILALVIPHDDSIRWFYTILPLDEILHHLTDDLGALGSRLEIQHSHDSPKHKQLYLFLQIEFTKTLEVPDHLDHLTAQSMTDYCPPIFDPDHALSRLESNYDFHSTGRKEKDSDSDAPLIPSDDRYLLTLPPAERCIAASVRLSCARYTLFKRRFFSAFHREIIVRGRERIGVGRKRVRTEHAHRVWMEGEWGWKGARAMRLVMGWKEMGFLEERRFLGLLEGGGLGDGFEEEREAAGGVRVDAT